MLGYNQQAVTWRAASSSARFSRPVSAPLSLQGVMRLDRQINQRAGGSGSRAFRPGPFARVNEAARRSAAAAGGRDRVRGTGAAGVRPCLSRRIGMPGCGPTRALATRQGNLRNPSANALNLVCYWPPHHSMNNFFLPTLPILSIVKTFILHSYKLFKNLEIINNIYLLLRLTYREQNCNMPIKLKA